MSSDILQVVGVSTRLDLENIRKENKISRKTLGVPSRPKSFTVLSYDDAVLEQSLRRIRYDAFALCTLSCAEMKATNHTMKGAAIPVSN